MEFFIVLVAIYVLFGAVGMKMAEKRGRSKLTGFVCGFFFGIIAFIVYGLLGETEEKKMERMEDYLRMRENRV
jgi:hypothetical protein